MSNPTNLPDQGKQPSPSNQPADPNEVVFVSLAEQLVIDNFEKEQWAGEQLIKQAVPLRFQQHLFVTSDPKQIKHIRDCGTYISRGCWEVPNVPAALKAIAEMEAVRKGVRTVEGRYETRETIDMVESQPEALAIAASPRTPMTTLPPQQ